MTPKTVALTFYRQLDGHNPAVNAYQNAALEELQRDMRDAVGQPYDQNLIIGSPTQVVMTFVPGTIIPMDPGGMAVIAIYELVAKDAD